MFIKTLKVILSILFIPVAVASTKAFFRNMEELSILSGSMRLLISGFLAYPIFHIVFVKPMYIYTFGHEIVHVIATWLCGGKVTSFQISSEGGSVGTTKDNLFIRISPYFVPIHLMFLCLVYWILSRFYDISRFSGTFIFLIGFTISFHVFMTIEVMKVRQPDMVKAGYFFSVILIYVINIAIGVLVLSAIFRDISFIEFAKDTYAFSKDIYVDIFHRFFG